MEAGSLRKAGEAGAGDGISKGGESREKWEIFRNIGTIFRNRKSTQRRELLRKGAKTESAGCGWQEVQTLLSPPPPPPHPLNTMPANSLVCIQTQISGGAILMFWGARHNIITTTKEIQSNI